MRSLRRRLLVVLGLGILLLTVGGALAATASVRDALEAGFDEQLAARAREVAAGLELELVPEARHRITQLGAALTGRLAAADQAEARARARRELAELARTGIRIRVAAPPARLEGEGEALRIETGDGTVLHASAPLAAGLPTRRLTYRTDAIRFASPAWNAAWQRIAGEDDSLSPRARIVVVRDASALETTLARLRTGLIAGGVLLALAAALLAWFATGRVLAPLTDVRRRVEVLDPGSLDRPLPMEGVPTELAPVVTTLNETLGRLGAAFDRERRLTGELAHELRTPIAELQTITDLASRWPDDADIQAHCVRQGEAIARHMARVVNALLRVARAESGEVALERTRLPLHDLVAAAWSRLETTTRAREQTLANDAPPELAVHADGEVLDTIVTNLLQNAATHAPRGSTVSTRAAADATTVRLTIANPQIAPAPEGAEHEGLGLPLVATLSRALGLQFSVKSSEAGFEATLAFPRRPTEDA